MQMLWCLPNSVNLHVSCPQELKHQVDLIHEVAKKVFAETGVTLEYKVGTMIEIPRAALVADEVRGTLQLFCNNSLPAQQLIPPDCE
jgi:hypothetical protein